MIPSLLPTQTTEGSNIIGNTANSNGGGIWSNGTANISDSVNIIGNTAASNGGGICVSAGTVTMAGGSVMGNTAAYGGGIYNWGTLNISGSAEISNNTATTNGGGISNGSTGTATMTGGTVTGNNAKYGGGIYNKGTLNISDSVQISKNTAAYGGGIYSYAGTATISGGSITENTANNNGGGIYNADSGTVTMSGGSITGNKATSWAGGINNFGTLNLTGGEVSGNTANVAGGVCNEATLNLGGTAVITQNTAKGVASNLYIDKSKTVTLSTDTPLASSAQIGVTVSGGTGNVTASASGNYAKYFTSDNADYTVKYNSEGYLELVIIPTEVASATYAASLTLTASIDINFKMSNLGTDGKGTGFDKSKLKITVDGDTWTGYTVSNGTLSGVLKAVEPKDIGTDLHIVITYDGVTVKDFTYSVSDYCNAVFKAQTADNALATPTGKYDKLADLCEALLNYGKYAEDYANGNTASTVNEGHVKDFTDYDFGTIGEEVVNGTAGAACLSLGSTIKLSYYVKTDKELTNEDTETQNFFVLNGKNEQIDPDRVTVKEETEDDRYNYVVSIDLYASQLSTSYTLKLKGVDTSKFCITYGVYNYCSRAQEYDVENYPAFTDTVKTLCKAIHNYSVAVDAYIASTTK